MSNINTLRAQFDRKPETTPAKSKPVVPHNSVMASLLGQFESSNPAAKSPNAPLIRRGNKLSAPVFNATPVTQEDQKPRQQKKPLSSEMAAFREKLKNLIKSPEQLKAAQAQEAKEKAEKAAAEKVKAEAEAAAAIIETAQVAVAATTETVVDTTANGNVPPPPPPPPPPAPSLSSKPRYKKGTVIQAASAEELKAAADAAAKNNKSATNAAKKGSDSMNAVLASLKNGAPALRRTQRPEKKLEDKQEDTQLSPKEILEQAKKRVVASQPSPSASLTRKTITRRGDTAIAAPCPNTSNQPQMPSWKARLLAKKADTTALQPVSSLVRNTVFNAPRPQALKHHVALSDNKQASQMSPKERLAMWKTPAKSENTTSTTSSLGRHSMFRAIGRATVGRSSHTVDSSVKPMTRQTISISHKQ